MHFGLRGCKEHRDMSWGNVKLKKTVDGEEFLEFNERQTKTRTGSDCCDVRKMRLKCLLLMNRKEILSWSTNFTPGRDRKQGTTMNLRFT